MSYDKIPALLERIAVSLETIAAGKSTVFDAIAVNAIKQLTAPNGVEPVAAVEPAAPVAAVEPAAPVAAVEPAKKTRAKAEKKAEAPVAAPVAEPAKEEPAAAPVAAPAEAAPAVTYPVSKEGIMAMAAAAVKAGKREDAINALRTGGIALKLSELTAPADIAKAHGILTGILAA